MSWQDEAVELRKCGKSIRAVARELGVAYSTLWDFLSRAAKDGESSVEYKPSVGVLDFESAPFKAYGWSRWKENVPQERVISEGYLLTYAIKMLGQDLIYSNHIHELENDYDLVKEVWGHLDNLDVVIGHNVVRFDFPLYNARAVYHNLPPYSPFRSIDTLQIAKKAFKFPSNSLKSLAIYLGCTNKIENEGFNLWKKVMNLDSEAIITFLAYNEGDVISTEEVYYKLRAWDKFHPNIGAFYNDGLTHCPCCGGTDLEEIDSVALTYLGQYSSMRCVGCGKISRKRTNLRSKESMSSTVVNIV